MSVRSPLRSFSRSTNRFRNNAKMLAIHAMIKKYAVVGVIGLFFMLVIYWRFF